MLEVEGGVRLGALGEGVVDEVEEPFVAAGAFKYPPAAGVEWSVQLVLFWYCLCWY